MQSSKAEACRKIIEAFDGYDIEFEITDARNIRLRVFLDIHHLTCVRLPIITYYEWKSPFFLDSAISSNLNYLRNEVDNLGGLAWTDSG